MQGHMRQLICAAAIAIGGVSLPPAAWACGCADTSLSERVTSGLANAERIFVGRVIVRNDLIATFVVEAVWKGDDAREVTLQQGQALPNGTFTISTCDYLFHLGVRYVVFAYRKDAALKASNCGPTEEWMDASQIAALLDSRTLRRSLRPIP
jgi:hypothetical protein